MILLNQPIQNILVFNVLTDLILLLLVCLKIYSSMRVTEFLLQTAQTPLKTFV